MWSTQLVYYTLSLLKSYVILSDGQTNISLPVCMFMGDMEMFDLCQIFAMNQLMYLEFVSLTN